MKFNSEKWIAQYKASTAKLSLPASAGMVCVHATLASIRDGLMDDFGKDSLAAKAVKESIGELWKSLTEAKTLAGFASNASGAAAAAGLKVDKASANIVDAL